MELPQGATEKDGKFYNANGELIEFYLGRWCAAVDDDVRITVTAAKWHGS